MHLCARTQTQDKIYSIIQVIQFLVIEIYFYFYEYFFIVFDKNSKMLLIRFTF